MLKTCFSLLIAVLVFSYIQCIVENRYGKSPTVEGDFVNDMIYSHQLFVRSNNANGKNQLIQLISKYSTDASISEERGCYMLHFSTIEAMEAFWIIIDLKGFMKAFNKEIDVMDKVFDYYGNKYHVEINMSILLEYAFENHISPETSAIKWIESWLASIMAENGNEAKITEDKDSSQTEATQLAPITNKALYNGIIVPKVHAAKKNTMHKSDITEFQVVEFRIIRIDV